MAHIRQKSGFNRRILLRFSSLVYKSLLPSLRITDTSNRTKNMGQAASLIPFLLNKAQTMPASILTGIPKRRILRLSFVPVV